MITIHNEMIYISNFRKIISIDDHQIYLIYNNKKLKIEGLGLIIKYLSKDDIEINGSIIKVEFYE